MYRKYLTELLRLDLVTQAVVGLLGQGAVTNGEIRQDFRPCAMVSPAESLDEFRYSISYNVLSRRASEK